MHFGYPPLMPLMYRNGGEALVSLFARARSLGLATSLDMAAVDPHTEAARADWAALIAAVLPQTDFFLPSAEELCFMLNRDRTQWLQRAAGGDIAASLDLERDVAPLAERLLALGGRVVVVKCGARGLYWRTAGEAALGSVSLPLSVSSWANRKGFQPAFRPRRAVSATGAGDVCIAAFLASALEGLSPEACARRAAAAGACCVEAFDALGGLMPFGALDKRVAEGWATC
jgi:sugar/nucleoside kinase (ribokinase family)